MGWNISLLIHSVEKSRHQPSGQILGSRNFNEILRVILYGILNADNFMMKMGTMLVGERANELTQVS